MKTDQRLILKLFGQDLAISHKSMYGDLNQLFRIGNSLRLAEGKQVYQLAAFLNSVEVGERVRLLEEDSSFKLDERGAFYKVGRGRNTRTEAHIMLLILAAEKIASKFHYELHKKVVLERLLEYRDSSGDQFILLNSAVDRNLLTDDMKAKGLDKKVYIKLAMLIKEGIAPTGGSWNTATAEELKKRTDIESKVVSMLDLGLIDSLEKLREVVIKLVDRVAE